MRYASDIDKTVLPGHVAIIMDGNGRWAQAKGKNRTAGHRAGMESVRGAIEYCVDIGIPRLTLFAFSTENWKRPQAEVDFIMGLVAEFLKKETPEMNANNIVLDFIGDLTRIPDRSRRAIDTSVSTLSRNSGLRVNIALNYGARNEIARAASLIADEARAGRLTGNVDEDLFASYLYDGSDVDLLVRPGAEKRISNFLLWQVAYAELYFTDTLWPDFDDACFDEAIRFFASRRRRFGGL